MRKIKSEKIQKSISKKLIQLRDALGYSQRTVAKDLHLNQAQLCHYENRTNIPSTINIIELADYYGVSIDWLVGRSKNTFLEDNEKI